MNNRQLTYTADVPDQDAFLRDILSKKLLLSHSLLVKLKQQHKIKVNGQWARTNYLLQAGDVISIDLDFSEENSIIPEPLPLDIVYEDEDFLVVNKPAGMSTHPSRQGGTGTLANAVTYYWQRMGCRCLFRPINRLDMDTSGLVLIGKSQFAHQGLFNQPKCRLIEKRYIALVDGLISKEQGRIDQPIARLDQNKRRRTIHPDGLPAVTDYEVIAKYPEHTLLSLTLETGRTHQIRVHLSFIGHPVCGDFLYGCKSPLIQRHALHAGQLSFIHPRNGQEINIQVPLAADMQTVIDHLVNP